MPLTSPDLEEVVKNLNSKERFYLADRLLSTLNSTQLLSLIDQAERVLRDLKLKKETSVLFDIRKINNNHYAYIKRLGQEYPNLYLGLIRFLKGKTYKITHKLSNTTFIVSGLGLEQEGLKTYLTIEFLLPEQTVRKYLFYDGSLDIPRMPQQIDIEQLDENINSIEGQAFISVINEGKPESNRLKNTVTPRKDWSAIFIKKDWIVEEVKLETEANFLNEEQEQANAVISKPKIIKKEPIDEKQILSIKRSQQLPQKEIGIKQNLGQTVIEVVSKLSAQVDEYLREWNTLCQLLVTDIPWEASFEPRRTILRNPSTKQIILKYDRNSNLLEASSPRLLHSLLMRIVSEMATNKIIKTEYRLLARKWLLNLKNPPLDNKKALLAFLFDL